VINSKLQVGIVGVGGIGHDQHLPAWSKVPFAQIVAAADLSEEALQRAAAVVPQLRTFRDWHELIHLAEVDIVDICTPNSTHAPIALAALAAGKHVLCEKPLATTAAEVRAMQDKARDAGRMLMAAQHLRFDPACRQLKALIDDGMLGEVYYSRAQWLRRRLLPPRPTFIDRRLSGGGAALDIGVHVLDLAYWFMGAPAPISVSATVETKLAKRSDLSGNWGDWDRDRIDVEDFAAAFVRFANNAVLTLEASWLTFQPDNEMIRLQCYGTRGGFIWPEGVLSGETNRVPWDLRPKECPKIHVHGELILQFASAIRDGLPSPIPVEESLSVARILDGLYQSAREKREITLE
jgi:predicted dehydrogenase